MLEHQTKLSDAEAFIKQRWSSERVFFNPEKVGPELREIADDIAKLTGTWNPVEIYTPSAANVLEQKTNFLAAFDKGEKYKPEFLYDVAEGMNVAETETRLLALREKVLANKPKNEMERLVRVVLGQKIKDDLTTCRLVTGIKEKDDQKVKAALQSKYPPPDAEVFRVAHERYTQMTLPETGIPPQMGMISPAEQEQLKKIEFSAEELKTAFEWLLNEYGILKSPTQPNGFNVVISDRATKIDVRDKSTEPMTIYIPKSQIVDGKGLLRLMTHEIEGHARQSVNGIELLGLGGGALRFDNEMMYEGLAMRLEALQNQKLYGVSEEDSPPWSPPFDILIMEQAAEGATFYELFKMSYEQRLRTVFKIPEGQPLIIDESTEENRKKMQKAKDATWLVVHKNLRGFSDMNNPAHSANTKDKAYLAGFLNDKKLNAAGYAEFNEMGIIPEKGLALLARLGVNNKDVPHPFQDLTTKYWLEVLKPKLQTT